MSDKPLTMHPFESAIVRTLEADNARLTADNEKLRAALLVARKYVLVQSCELSLQPEDAARESERLEKVLAPQQVITDRCAAAIRGLIKE